MTMKRYSKQRSRRSSTPTSKHWGDSKIRSWIGRVKRTDNSRLLCYCSKKPTGNVNRGTIKQHWENSKYQIRRRISQGHQARKKCPSQAMNRRISIRLATQSQWRSTSQERENWTSRLIWAGNRSIQSVVSYSVRMTIRQTTHRCWVHRTSRLRNSRGRNSHNTRRMGRIARRRSLFSGMRKRRRNCWIWFGRGSCDFNNLTNSNEIDVAGYSSRKHGWP